MTEGTINGKIMEATGRALRGAVVTKHADRFTRDEPDISVIYLGYTFYCETKYVRRGQTIQQVLRATRKHSVSQLLHLGQIHTASDGKAWAVIYDDNGPQVSIWTPAALFCEAFPELTPRKGGTVPFRVNPEIDSLPGCLFSHRAISLPGRPYDALANLIAQKVRG